MTGETWDPRGRLLASFQVRIVERLLEGRLIIQIQNHAYFFGRDFRHIACVRPYDLPCADFRPGGQKLLVQGRVKNYGMAAPPLVGRQYDQLSARIELVNEL